MKTISTVAIALGALTTLTAAAPITNFEAALELSSRDLASTVENDDELERRLLGKIVKGVGHLFHRHHRRDMADEYDQLDYLDARDLGVEAEDQLEPRLLGKIVKGVGHLFHRHHRRDLLGSEEDDLDSQFEAREFADFEDEELDPRLLGVGMAFKAAKGIGKAAAHGIANRHRNKNNKRDLFTEVEDQSFETRAELDDEDLDPRLLGVGMAFKAAKGIGKAAAHGIANRHRNKNNKRDLLTEVEEQSFETRAELDDEDLDPRLLGVGMAFKAAKGIGKAAAHGIANRHRNKNKRDFLTEEEEEEQFLEARDWDALLQGRDDFAAFE